MNYISPLAHVVFFKIHFTKSQKIEFPGSTVTNWLGQSNAREGLQALKSIQSSGANTYTCVQGVAPIMELKKSF